MNSLLGEYVLDTAKALNSNHHTLEFDYSNHPTKISAVETLKGKSGVLVLNKLSIDSFQKQEYLIFTAVDDDDQVLDQEICEKLFSCFGRIKEENETLYNDKLISNQHRQVEAKVSEVLEANNQYFQDERDRLEKWADDKIFSAELALKDTKTKRNSLKRESRLAVTMEEQRNIQLELKGLEIKQRKQRKDIFDLEDEVISKRDELIESLEIRLKQKTEVKNLFTIRWVVN
jgi:chemotaxis protein histidine kinase CheA